MEDETFMMVDENGNEKEALVINVIEALGNEYVVYGIEEDNDNYGIYSSRLIKNPSGDFEIISIEDEEEKNKINAIVMDLLKEGN